MLGQKEILSILGFHGDQEKDLAPVLAEEGRERREGIRERRKESTRGLADHLTFVAFLIPFVFK